MQTEIKALADLKSIIAQKYGSDWESCSTTDEGQSNQRLSWNYSRKMWKNGKDKSHSRCPAAGHATTSLG